VVKFSSGPLGTIALLLAVAAAAVVYLVLDRQRTPPDFRFRVNLGDQGVVLRTVTVYVVEPDSLALVPLSREVLAEDGLGPLVRMLVEQMAEPREGLRAPLPPGARVLHCFRVGGAELVLDFNEALGGTAGGNIVLEQLRLMALCRTLADNVPGVSRVRLLVHGQPLTRWGDHLALPEAVEIRST
jgi:hypothetical protein